jgi:hypothetical protein
MALKARTVVPLTLAVSAVLMLVVASMASATHPRPKGATPFRVPVVPAFNQCTAANGEAFVKLEVLVGAPGPPDDSDVIITSNGTDIRCKAGVTACGSANAADGADYTGELQGNATIRITDHFNGIAAGGGTDPATVVDIPFPVNANCAATASTAIGGTCTSNTSANATVPGSVKDGKRSTVEIGQIQITDGGPDGLVGTSPNTLFGVQGIFIP